MRAVRRITKLEMELMTKSIETRELERWGLQQRLEEGVYL